HAVHDVLLAVGLDGAVKTSGAKGAHVFMPLDGSNPPEDVAAAARALAARTAATVPELATTAFLKDERGGRLFVDSTRVGGAAVCRSRAPSDGTGSTTWCRARPPSTTRWRAWAAPIRGRPRCRRHSPSPPTWSPRATRSPWHACRPCTRGNGGPAGEQTRRAT